jgi:hypothetical protein
MVNRRWISFVFRQVRALLDFVTSRGRVGLF